MGSGQWAVGSGQWAVGSGQWAVGSESKIFLELHVQAFFTADCGLPTADQLVQLKEHRPATAGGTAGIRIEYHDGLAVLAIYSERYPAFH